jgi:hypothetical protein
MRAQKLRDIKWIIETVSFDDGQFMTNATMEIVAVTYNVKSMTASIDVRFSEGSYGVIKTYLYELDQDSEESISTENINQFISQALPSAVEQKPK